MKTNSSLLYITHDSIYQLAQCGVSVGQMWMSKSNFACIWLQWSGWLTYDMCLTAAVIVVFDFSNFDSLQKARQWKQDACSNVETENPLVFLVGSKKDLVVCATHLNLCDET